MKTLALTFDDGPDRDGTPLVLDALARHEARATFFVIAPRAAAHPELIGRIISDGHTIGLHCDEHVRHSERDADWCATDTRRALGRLHEQGIAPTLWRTPWGDTAPWTERVATDHNLTIIGWTVDTHDWRGDDAERMYADTRGRLDDGAIVLAHDGLGPGATRENADATAAYVELIAEHSRRHGLALAALGVITGRVSAGRPPAALELDGALAQIAAGAPARDADRTPRFPADAFAVLRAAGALSFNAFTGRPRPPAADELDLVRRVAAADGSVGRIFDGHLNGVERIAVQGRAPLRDAELAAVAAGELLVGVWGGDPVPGEGPPAALHRAGGREMLRGVKTFCSGAGGLDRAMVLARSPAGGPPVSVWIDVADRRCVEIDESWYRSHGLVASVSHRVVFHDAPVLARLGEPGAIAAQPWFGRDALRTAASWAGMADTAVQGALASLAERGGQGESSQLEALAAGRILTHQRTIDAWLAQAAAAMDDGTAAVGDVALHARVAIADACRRLLDEAARACGSRPFARAEALDRARRDLELFLLQHRLEPMLARYGEAAIATARGDG